jgi:hypothetical protein
VTAEEAIGKLRKLGVRFHREKTVAGALRDDKGRCPIIALAESMTAVTYDNCQWGEAADVVEMTYRDALDLVTVADDVQVLAFIKAGVLSCDLDKLTRLESLRNQLLSLCEDQ